MKISRFVFAFLLASSFGAAAGQAGEKSKIAVLELFTSQGCSSCPPADALLKEFTDQDDVLALSFNVDYWDYLGWKDTLASAENTERQQSYARHGSRRGVFTPEMMIDGKWSVVGSDRRAVEEALRKSRQASGSSLNVEVKAMHGKIVVRIDGPADTGDAIIWLVRFDKEHLVTIRRGENRGRQIAYNNVVRDFHSLGMWQGKAMEITLMREQLMAGGRDGCAIIVQKNRHGPILGAAAIGF